MKHISYNIWPVITAGVDFRRDLILPRRENGENEKQGRIQTRKHGGTGEGTSQKTLVNVCETLLSQLFTQTQPS